MVTAYVFATSGFANSQINTNLHTMDGPWLRPRREVPKHLGRFEWPCWTRRCSSGPRGSVGGRLSRLGARRPGLVTLEVVPSGRRRAPSVRRPRTAPSAPPATTSSQPNPVLDERVRYTAFSSTVCRTAYDDESRIDCRPSTSNDASRRVVAVVSVWSREGPSGTGGAAGRGVLGGALPTCPDALQIGRRALHA
jgi:hypothetical protein